MEIAMLETLFWGKTYTFLQDGWASKTLKMIRNVLSLKILLCLLQIYYWALFSNLILRISWTYKLSSHLRHNEFTVFIVAALEMVRRFQWIFFRVENEWNKMTAKGIGGTLSDGDLAAVAKGPLNGEKAKDREEEKGLLYVEYD